MSSGNVLREKEFTPEVLYLDKSDMRVELFLYLLRTGEYYLPLCFLRKLFENALPSK